MRMTRRNALIGMGTIAAGTGAIFGSGAFTTVEAERSATVTLADDDEALLALSGNNEEYIDEDADGLIEFTFENLNRGGTTTFEDILNIENNGTNPVDISMEFRDSDGEEIDGDDGDILNDVITFDPAAPNIASEADEDLTIVFETRPDEITGTPSQTEIDDALDELDAIAITAQDSS